MAYEMVIGLEVHVQLNTNTKIFCGCSTQFGASANSQTCPICQGHPGVLPVLNKEVLKRAVMAGMALNCEINKFSKFDRKNYFYPDLPKAYQISQFDLPICGRGYLDIEKSDGEVKRIGVTRIHMEEDAGKLVHSEVKGVNESYVDLNRSSTPLLEIVSEPDMRSAEEAVLYLQKLRQNMKYLGVSDVNMEEGSMRCDVNISLRPQGQKEFGTRAEIKNLNSFSSVKKAIEYEFDRQEEILDSKGEVVQETRLFNVDTGETRSMRSKEEAHDYRYFPDPDLVPVTVSQEQLDDIRANLPELPESFLTRFIEEYKVKADDANVLVSEKEYALYFEKAVQASKPELAQRIANFLLSDVIGAVKDQGIAFADLKINPAEIGKIYQLIDKGTISIKIAKEILPDLMQGELGVEAIIEKKGMTQISDTSAIEKIVDDVIEANPQSIEQYKAGKTKVTGFLVGQVMKLSRGKANPQMVNKILKEKLDTLK